MRTSKLNSRDAELLGMLDNAVDHYDTGNTKGEGVYHAEGDGSSLPSEKLSLANVPGNPQFGATISMEMSIKYFSVNAGAYTLLTAAQILAASATLANRIPSFIFGQIDYEGGFTYAQSRFPLTTWQYDTTPFVYGKDWAGTIFGVLDATAKAQLQRGDLVLPLYATVAATNYVALSIIRTTGVSYGKLLNALGSNRFYINNIRYTVSDDQVGYNQLKNNIEVIGQTMFGKFRGDTVPSTLFKSPFQFQKNIVDVPIKKGFDKSSGLGTWLNYDSVSQTFDFFVATWVDLEA